MSLEFKEKRNLFYQYLVLFTVSAAALLLALFFTQQKNNFTIPSQEKVKYDEFVSFDKSTNRIIMLIDTVAAQAGKIITESGHDEYNIQTAHQLIEEFEPDKNASPANNAFIRNIMEMLNRAIKTAEEKKRHDNDYGDDKNKLDQCNNDLRD